MNAFLLLLALSAGNMSSDKPDGVWSDIQGNPLPNTSFRKSINGFGGWLVVTPDQNWEEKWNTPSDTVPQFSEAKSVSMGKKIFVLIFFSNPAFSQEGEASVTCDFDVERPDGTHSIQKPGVVCFKGSLKGPQANLYLSAPVINFLGESGDPPGIWIVRVTLKDQVKNTNIPLETTFTLQ